MSKLTSYDTPMGALKGLAERTHLTESERQFLRDTIEKIEDDADEIKRLEAKSYPHMCREYHQEIGHRDSEADFCPLCLSRCDVEDAEEKIRGLLKLLERTLAHIEPEQALAHTINQELSDARNLKEPK